MEKSESVVTLRVRETETDPYGIAHHASYAVWAEMGLRALDAFPGAEKAWVAGFECKYLRSAAAGDEIRVRSRITGQADGETTVSFEILREKTLLASGTMAVKTK